MSNRREIWAFAIALVIVAALLVGFLTLDPAGEGETDVVRDPRTTGEVNGADAPTSGTHPPEARR